MAIQTKALAVARIKMRMAPRRSLSPAMPLHTMVRLSSYNLACLSRGQEVSEEALFTSKCWSRFFPLTLFHLLYL